MIQSIQRQVNKYSPKWKQRKIRWNLKEEGEEGGGGGRGGGGGIGEGGRRKECNNIKEFWENNKESKICIIRPIKERWNKVCVINEQIIEENFLFFFFNIFF